MAKNCIGLDIGSSSVKAIELKETSKGMVLQSFGIEPLPSQTIVEGAVMDQNALVDAIRRLRARVGLRGKQVATAVAGNSVIIKKIQVPPMTREELAEQIPWEAEHHLPFPKDEVEIDHEVLLEQNAAGQMELMLVAAKKEIIADYTNVIRAAKLEAAVVDVSPFAIQNAFEVAYGWNQNEGIALIKVGASLSSVNIVIGGQSVFTRDVPSGGNAITEEIQQQLRVSWEEAEGFKVAATGTDEIEVPPEVSSIVSQAADALAGKIQRSIDFYLASGTQSSLAQIYLCGGTAKVPALVQMLYEKSRIPVEVMDPFRRLNIDEKKFDVEFLRSHAAEAAVALGLALRKPGGKA